MQPPQAGWAQQYDHDLKPAWARTFEPPGVCTLVTARNIRTLVDLYLYTKDKKYLRPIPNAIDWLESSKIGDNLWARLYEVGTNRPVYGDRKDGNKVHYNYEGISEYERKSYSWQGAYGIEEAIAYYDNVKSSDEGKDPSVKSSELTPEQCLQKVETLAPAVKKVIDALDEKGRWIRDDMIHSEDFVRNVDLLCSYLETCSGGGK